MVGATANKTIHLEAAHLQTNGTVSHLSLAADTCDSTHGADVHPLAAATIRSTQYAAERL